jgi:hypothetical protein
MTIPFSNCVLVGVGATPDYLRTDGDILIGTPENRLLFSEGVLYFNDEHVGVENADLLNTIRDAFYSITPWQPIESAPKDGTKFLVWYRNRTTIGWFHNDELYLEGSSDSYGPRSVIHGGTHGRVATHWMRLPGSPVEST